MTQSALVTSEWLAERLGEPRIKVVDGSWYLPAMERDPEAEYLAAHIPGAVRFNIDEVADLSTGLPHMLPDAETFAEAAGKLGLSEADTIVIYDGMGVFSAARVWWTFKVMGAADVRILDGGLPAWQVGGHPTESGEVHTAPAVFRATRNDDAVWNAEKVQRRDNLIQLVDMRPAARFEGAAAEPRAGLKSGHIPGSANLPFSELVAGDKLRSPEDIHRAIAAAGIDPDAPIVTSCGSGVTAAMLNLALNEIGVEVLDLYDGSWAEWGAREDLPVEMD